MTNFFIDEDFDLQSFNTLALPARARYFASITSVDALRQAMIWARDKNLPLLTLGGGSTVILAGDWPGLSASDLNEARDLRATTDLRSLFKGVLATQLKLPEAVLDARVFPDSRDVKPLDGLLV